MRTATKEIVKRIYKILRDERPDYIYLRDLFRKIRTEFDIEVTTKNKRLPYVSQSASNYIENTIQCNICIFFQKF